MVILFTPEPQRQHGMCTYFQGAMGVSSCQMICLRILSVNFNQGHILPLSANIKIDFVHNFITHFAVVLYVSLALTALQKTLGRASSVGRKKATRKHLREPIPLPIRYICCFNNSNVQKSLMCIWTQVCKIHILTDNHVPDFFSFKKVQQFNNTTLQKMVYLAMLRNTLNVHWSHIGT